MKIKTLLPTLALASTSLLPLYAEERQNTFYLIEDDFTQAETLAYIQKAKQGELSWAKGNGEKDPSSEAPNIYGLSDPFANALFATFHGFETEITFDEVFELAQAAPNNPKVLELALSLTQAVEDSQHSIEHHWDHIHTLANSTHKFPSDSTDYLTHVYPQAWNALLQALAPNAAPVLIHDDFDVRSAYFDFLVYQTACTPEQDTYSTDDLNTLAGALYSCYDYEAQRPISDSLKDIDCKTELLDFINTHLRARMYAVKIIQILKSNPTLPLIASLEPNTLDLVKSCLESQGYTPGNPEDLDTELSN